MAQQHPMSLIHSLAIQQVLMQRGMFLCPPQQDRGTCSEGWHPPGSHGHKEKASVGTSLLRLPRLSQGLVFSFPSHKGM